MSIRTTAGATVRAASAALAAVQVRWFARSAATEVIVLDIDNTLADAWPSFLEPHANQRDRLAALQALPNIRTVAYDRPKADGASVVFVSHRNLWEWPVTRSWLERNGYDASLRNLILVTDPAQKVGIVERLAEHHRVTVWDDLSFGHEDGEIRFYAEVIAALGRLRIDYHGWDDIVAVTGRGPV